MAIPKFITLDQIEEYAHLPVLPSIRVVQKHFNILDFVAGDVKPGDVNSDPTVLPLGELGQTWQSVRDGGRPKTVMHALALRDGLTISRLAAITGQDVLEVQGSLAQLELSGLVASATDTDGVVSYAIPDIEA